MAALCPDEIAMHDTENGIHRIPVDALDSYPGLGFSRGPKDA